MPSPFHSDSIIGNLLVAISMSQCVPHPDADSKAFDHISIPAISAETERVFSDTKFFIPESCSRLGPAVIGALECVRR